MIWAECRLEQGRCGSRAPGRLMMNYSNRTRDSATPLSSPELELIYRTAPIGLAFLTTDCRYVAVNERLTEICGIPVGDHIGRSVRETVPQVAEQVEHIVQTILRTGDSIIGVEVKGQRPDGSNLDRVWITHWHPLKDRYGNIIGINVAAEEITERKRFETDLDAVQDQLRSLNSSLAVRVEAQAQERDRIWNLSRDLLVVSDARGLIHNVNPAWFSTLGWSPDDLIGKSGERLIHPDDRERSLAERAKLVDGQATLHFENRVLCKDGSYRWISWFAVPQQGLFYSTGRDVTNLKQTQDQLRALRDAITDAARQTTMDTMTASIVHEITQPLTAMVANASAALKWLRNSEPDLAQARKCLSQIVEGGSRANEIIAGIRSMFGKQSRETSLVDIRSLVGDVILLVKDDLESNRIRLVNKIPDWLPEVRAAPVQLQQVILNLITNAIEAMSCVTDRDRILTIASVCDQPSGSMTLSVEDTGGGIDLVDLDRVFDPFFTTKAHGMGLGLAISRSIVEAHGGKLRASSISPFGTALHLTLPIPA